jgi:Family of unknown function (DUF6526)
LAEREQNYKSHTRLLPPFHFFVVPVMLVNLVNAVRHVIQQPTLHFTWEVIFAMGLVMLALFSRVQALTVQDRVIRLEERLRLRELLPPELHPHINSFSHRQLVALRFASDDEVPELAREILGGRLTTAKDIKLRVKNWRADWLRA